MQNWRNNFFDSFSNSHPYSHPHTHTNSNTDSYNHFSSSSPNQSLRITTSINIPKPHSLELLLQEKHIHGGCMEQTQPASAVQLQEHSLAIQVLLQFQLPPNSQSTSAQPPTEHFSGLKQQTLLAPSSAVQLTPEDLTGGMLTLIQELTAGLRKIIW